MSDPVDALIVELLEWIGPQGRPYAEVMDAWRTSCPRLPVWEEANARGYLLHEQAAGTGALISISPDGLALLTAASMQLVRPTAEHLPGYIAALKRGWSADNVRGAAAAREELEQIEADPVAFLAGFDDREAKGPPVKLPDGSLVTRLPGFRRWLWDGEFAGSISIRWQPGTTALPPHCLGHIGYAVVPWKQGKGYAKAALRLFLKEAESIGLPFVELTTDPDNAASRRVIEANGGELVEHFVKPPQFGSEPGVRYRIVLHEDG